MAVRMLRRAILSSRDHFMMGQYSCRSKPSNKGIFCTAARALTRGFRVRHAGVTSTRYQHFGRHAANAPGNSAVLCSNGHHTAAARGAGVSGMRRPEQRLSMPQFEQSAVLKAQSGADTKKGHVQMARGPLFTYGVGGIPIVGRAAVAICEQALSMQPPTWLTSLPWSIIVAISLSLWLGQLLADARNGHSWLRRDWKRITRLFDVIEPPVRHGNVLGIDTKIRFVRKIRHATIILHVAGWRGMAYPVDSGRCYI